MSPLFQVPIIPRKGNEADIEYLRKKYAGSRDAIYYKKPENYENTDHENTVKEGEKN